MGITRCGSSCFLKGGDCKSKRDCSCTVCNTLAAISPNLYETCSTACNADDSNLRPQSLKQFLDRIGPNELWSRYGYAVDGFDPRKTDEFKLQKDEQDRINNQEGFLQKVILFAMVVLVGIVILISLKK